MTTPIYLTGFEHGFTPTTNGGGLAAFVQGVSVVSTEHNTGSYSLKATPTSAAAYMRWAISGAPGEACGRVYFKIETESTTDQLIFDLTTVTGGVTTEPRLYINVANNKIDLKVGATLIASSSNTYVVGQWHYIDFYFDVNQNPWSLKAKLDGGTEFSGTSATAADTFAAVRIGPSLGSSALVIYYDDIVVSTNLADYPIGPGGTQILMPGSGGTSNPGTNIMEEEDGTDVGASSYLAINSIPMGDATAYIRQAGTGTGNYMEALFNNITDSHGSILGAMGILAYTSATTTTNKGACIISKDSFSTSTTIWGAPAATADYSDGSTASPYWKVAIISGVTDDTTVNALAVRLGYSDDANPNPYWLDVGVEVAYTIATNEISLALVSYSITYPALTVLENTVIPLDLVTYSSSVKDMVLTENIPISLDLVTYSRSFPVLTILENIATQLDLVTYSISYPNITILENVVVPLDLVTYSTSYPILLFTENVIVTLDLVTYSNVFPNLTTVENDLVSLDLVSYFHTYPDLSLLENVVSGLDLVTYFDTFPNLTILENTVIALDLVSYSVSVNDITVLESSIISLDLVAYSNSVLSVDLLEEGSLSLDPVIFTITVNPIQIIEHEIISLDLVDYLTDFPSVELLEEGNITLDLVIYNISVQDLQILESIPVSLELVGFSSLVFDVSFETLVVETNVPMSRTYSIPKETRVLIVEEFDRYFPVGSGCRTHSISNDIRVLSIEKGDRNYGSI